MKANIQEIFRSIQGEGQYAGAPAVFVRFSGCNLRCGYCDTKQSWRKTGYCAYQPDSFAGRPVRIPNDIALPDCAALIRRLAPDGLICFTGGEPLLQAEYIAGVIRLLGAKYTYLLETNGTLPRAPQILPNARNIVYSIDLKTPAAQFSSFYQAVPQKAQKYIKIILEKDLDPERLQNVLQKVYKMHDILYLQPVNNRIDPAVLKKITAVLEKNKYAYRLIPQIHKFLRLK
ncbi:MAG: 7-carboxy-7-deazaguanine synthase QueE [Candidatus Margulisbacteria bacterium]|jgi:7-carboxy-7-deazaguanine synthase|nr:7-carboxy-7-deazaguanine synthase QueE [Candidatus Margulisiibacteriota bacterium]